jgi:hypothetical protein
MQEIKQMKHIMDQTEKTSIKVKDLMIQPDLNYANGKIMTPTDISLKKLPKTKIQIID